MRSLSIKHFKQRQPLRKRRFLILRALKALVVEVYEDMKEVNSKSVNKTGMAEDKVEVMVVEVEDDNQAT